MSLFNKIRFYWITTGITFIVIACLSIYTASIFPGYKRYTQHSILQSFKLEGTYVDCNGNEITDTSDKTRGKERAILDEYSQCYGWLIGSYASDKLQVGVRNQLQNSTYGILPHKIKLTTDNQLMSYCYDMLNSLTSSGSIIVIDNETGAIKAFVSRSPVTLDINNIDEFCEEADNSEDSFNWRGVQFALAPGSVFKIVSATALLEKNVDLDYYDTGEYNNIHNHDNYVYGNVDLNTAIQYSLNTYFAQKVNEEVGYDEFKRICEEDFLIGQKIDLDFCSLNSQLKMEEDTVDDTAFGQSELKIPDLMIAMWMLGVVNNGSYIAPHLLASTDTTVLSTICTEQEAQQLQTALSYAASEYGLGEDCIAKTGTAELDDYKNVHSYMVASNGTYTYMISAATSNVVVDSTSLYEPMANLIAYYS